MNNIDRLFWNNKDLTYLHKGGNGFACRVPVNIGDSFILRRMETVIAYFLFENLF